MKTTANSHFGSEHVELNNEGFAVKQSSTSGSELSFKSDNYVNGLYYFDQRKCVALINGSFSNKNIYNEINQSLSGQGVLRIKTTDFEK